MSTTLSAQAFDCTHFKISNRVDSLRRNYTHVLPALRISLASENTMWGKHPFGILRNGRSSLSSGSSSPSSELRSAFDKSTLWKKNRVNNADNNTKLESGRMWTRKTKLGSEPGFPRHSCPFSLILMTYDVCVRMKIKILTILLWCSTTSALYFQNYRILNSGAFVVVILHTWWYSLFIITNYKTKIEINILLAMRLHKSNTSKNRVVHYKIPFRPKMIVACISAILHSHIISYRTLLC